MWCLAWQGVVWRSTIKKFTSLVENYLERGCATGVLEYFCRGNQWSSFWQIIKRICHFCGGNVWCLAQQGAVWQSTIKNLHCWWRIIWREIMLLVYSNTFAEEISEAHSDKLLKDLSFLQRHCVVLSLVGHSPAEYHKKFTLVLKYFFRGNQWSSFRQIIKIFVIFAEAICGA